MNFVIRVAGGGEGISHFPNPSPEVAVNKPTYRNRNVICNQNIIHKLLHESITELPIEYCRASNYCLAAVHRTRDDPTGRDGGVQSGAGNPGYSGDY